jgi:hypothetical protein
MFSIAHFKDDAMVDHLELSSASHKSDINSLKAAHDLEMDLFTSFFTFVFG